MNLKQPAQYYWTTLFDQHQEQSLSFCFIPQRSFRNNEVPQKDDIARLLDAKLLVHPEIAPWHLPVLLACLLPGGRLEPPSQLLDQLLHGVSVWIDPHRIGFAQYVAYSDVIPFEESSPKGKSLMAIASLAAQISVIVTDHGSMVALVVVPLGILLCTAAAEFGAELGKKLPKLIGLR